MRALRSRLASHPSGTAAAALLVLLAAAAMRQPALLSGRVLLDLLEDGAVLGLVALAATWAILSGGIDLSVGALMSLCSIVLAASIEKHGFPPALAISAVLALGLAFGAGTGTIVHFLGLPPFLVTLSGLFLARGLALSVHVEALAIRDPSWNALARAGLELSSLGRLSLLAPLLLLAVLACAFLLRQTRFGRDVLALGGNAELARLAGVPVGRTRIGVYALSGLFSALAGVAYALYGGAGSSTAGVGLELDAITAVVVGGAHLSGGYGGAAGTLLGVLFLGALQSFLILEGTLSAGWARVAGGALLLAFLVLQRWVGHGASEDPQ